MADLFLAVDAGGTAVKAAVFDMTGRLVAQRSIEVVTVHRENGWVEREPEAFWRGTATAIRQLTSGEIKADRVAAVACTGFGNGVFLVDAEGRATRDGIVSVDHRAQGIVDEFTRNGMGKRIEAITGQQIWGGQTLMQLVWLARNEPAVVRQTRWALACKDFLRMRLTGVATTDPTDAVAAACWMWPVAATTMRSSKQLEFPNLPIACLRLSRIRASRDRCRVRRRRKQG